VILWHFSAVDISMMMMMMITVICFKGHFNIMFLSPAYKLSL